MSYRPDDAPAHQDQPTGTSHLEESGPQSDRIAIALPEIPTTDLSLDFASFIDPETPEGQKIQKRASNVMKLAEENEKLKAELKAMTDRLEAAERATRRREQIHREQKIMEEPSS